MTSSLERLITAKEFYNWKPIDVARFVCQYERIRTEGHFDMIDVDAYLPELRVNTGIDLHVDESHILVLMQNFCRDLVCQASRLTGNEEK